MLRIALVVPSTEAEGPGRRTAIWLQGCTIRCPGCCNPELFSRSGGREHTVAELLGQVPSGVEGVTVLGGEPLDQPEGLTALAAAARASGLTVVVFSGYHREEVERRAPGLLADVDVLVDGPYDASQPESGATRPRRWIGSANQGLHFLTSRYDAHDFHGANTVELRLRAGVVVVNGWPT